VLWTRLQLANPGAAIVVYLFASAIAVQTTIQPLPPQIIDDKTTLPTPPGHVRCRCSLIDHTIAIGSNACNNGGRRWRRTTCAGRRRWRKRSRKSSSPPLEMALLARRGRNCRPSSPRNAGRDVSSGSLIGQFFLLNQTRQPTSPAMTNT
jgi:hypothetical protein